MTKPKTRTVTDPLIRGAWKLKDLTDGRIGAKPNGLKVFSTFACGGGSTMGYKLAGCEVIGAVEIDPKMAAIYRYNHHPRHMIEGPIQEFNRSFKEGGFKNVEIDILDGSPPCSAFSMAGAREEKWGKHTHFREGQAKQVLTDLFFHFIETARLLRPKVVIAENVKGMLAGNAKGYCRRVLSELKEAGYETQVFLLNAAYMGVPQKRERVFFISRRNDLKMRPLRMDFNEPPIFPEQAFRGLRNQTGKTLIPSIKGSREWCFRRRSHKVADFIIETKGKNAHFTQMLILPKRVANTQIGANRHMHWAEDRYLSDLEVMRIQSFPDDYNFLSTDPGYVCGMSVPPLMMQRVAMKVVEAWP